MRIISIMCPALILAGCTFLNDTPPKVIYQSSDTISVEYADDGLMRVSNRQEALEGHIGSLGGLAGVLTPSAFDRAVKSKRLPARSGRDSRPPRGSRTHGPGNAFTARNRQTTRARL
jgi:hypothetical protein